MYVTEHRTYVGDNGVEHGGANVKVIFTGTTYADN